MTTRRDLLAASAGTFAAWAWPLAAAPTPDPERLALVIGNDRYGNAPLANAVNDARSMAALLRDAGFTVDARLDTTAAAMREAVRAFADAAAKPAVKSAFFFYAGHAVQVDWRNFLLPVDAQVARAGDVQAQGVELAALTAPLAAARGKVFVILLDACRDNPFGDRYVPDQKGLSQFDAPVGSLIGFSTAPGSVASDGAGGHGLYTENLVRELAVRGARLEDALKRVRVNVRLASQGAQVPWESTSLETDVYVYPPERAPTRADEERADREEMAGIAALRGSSDPAAWARFIRAHPRGKFSEIAQARLEQLVPAQRRGPLPRPNPHSAGTFPLERRFSVGDGAIYEDLDQAPGSRRRTITQLVTRIDRAADRIEFNHGAFVTDLLGNPIKVPHVEFDAPVQLAPATLQVGQRWSARHRQVAGRGRRDFEFDLDLAVVRRERVTVLAGTFEAFRIEGRARAGSGIEGGLAIWEVPGLNFPVQRNRILRRGDRVLDTERVQLVSWTQARK